MLRLTKTHCYLLLRWIALIGGVYACVSVLLRRHQDIHWQEAFLLSALIALLNLRGVVMQRATDGKPTLHQASGDALILVALLHGGAATVLAVSLLSSLVMVPVQWRMYRTNYLPPVSNFFYLPALYWLGGWLYQHLGGIPLTQPQDCATFFDHPMASLLPILAMLLITTELINRPFTALLLYTRNNVSLKETLRDPMLSFFDYVESLGGLVMLLFWVAWGWATLPLTILIYEALLMSGNNYFENLESSRHAESDTLTGLASWRKLTQYLRRHVAAHKPFALLFLDVDGLKRVNDKFGHTAGDELLRLIGEACRLHARKGDMVGRRSGDEFLLVLEGLERPEAEAVLARLQRGIEAELAAHPDFAAAAAGASIGLALYPQDAQSEEALVEIADHQMYRNKRARRAERGVVEIDPRLLPTS
jgi:diguanylate cyclase (GGDEF)-like protein